MTPLSPEAKQALRDLLVNTGLNVAAIALAALIVAPYLLPLLRKKS